MKTIKEKTTSIKPKTTSSTPVPKAVIKEALIRSKEKSMEIAEQIGATGQEPDAQNHPASEAGDTVTGAIDRGVDYSAKQVYRAGRTMREQAVRHRQSPRNSPPSTPETSSSAPSTMPKSKPAQSDVKPSVKQKSNRTKPAKERTPQQAIKPPNKRLRALQPAPKGAMPVQQVVSQAAPIRFRQKVLKTAGKLREMADAVARAIRASIQAIRSMFAAISAVGAIAATIIIIICLVAFIAGSAYGIFFAAEAPGEDVLTVRAVVELLSAEYRDAIQEIENTVPHDREEVESNDGAYSIQWQAVLAVYSSHISGDEYGSPVAALTEEQVEKLRQTMWEMNELDYTTYTETITLPNAEEESHEDESEEEEPQTISLTVLVIQLTHKTPEEMSAGYNFNSRQQEYLNLLQSPETETLWDDLLGSFAAGGEILTPSGGWTPNGALQWPLPVSGSITSPYGYRTDPISGQTSYHSGTDIAAPNGTPILAAADGTVVIANGTDSWGGSYGYYVKLDHGGIQTLYAHCSAICVTSGQQVQAGQVIAYVGSTGRSTGNHLHFEVFVGGTRADPLSFFG